MYFLLFFESKSKKDVKQSEVRQLVCRFFIGPEQSRDASQVVCFSILFSSWSVLFFFFLFGSTFWGNAFRRQNSKTILFFFLSYPPPPSNYGQIVIFDIYLGSGIPTPLSSEEGGATTHGGHEPSSGQFSHKIKERSREEKVNTRRLLFIFISL